MRKGTSRKLRPSDFETVCVELTEEKAEELKDPENFQKHVYEWHKKHSPKEIENLKPEDIKVWHFNEKTNSFEVFQK